MLCAWWYECLTLCTTAGDPFFFLCLLLLSLLISSIFLPPLSLSFIVFLLSAPSPLPYLTSSASAFVLLPFLSNYYLVKVQWISYSPLQTGRNFVSLLIHSYSVKYWDIWTLSCHIACLVCGTYRFVYKLQNWLSFEIDLNSNSSFLFFGLVHIFDCIYKLEAGFCLKLIWTLIYHIFSLVWCIYITVYIIKMLS